MEGRESKHSWILSKILQLIMNLAFFTGSHRELHKIGVGVEQLPSGYLEALTRRKIINRRELEDAQELYDYSKVE